MHLVPLSIRQRMAAAEEDPPKSSVHRPSAITAFAYNMHQLHHLLNICLVSACCGTRPCGGTSMTCSEKMRPPNFVQFLWCRNPRKANALVPCSMKALYQMDLSHDGIHDVALAALRGVAAHA